MKKHFEGKALALKSETETSLVLSQYSRFVVL